MLAWLAASNSLSALNRQTPWFSSPNQGDLRSWRKTSIDWEAYEELFFSNCYESLWADLEWYHLASTSLMRASMREREGYIVGKRGLERALRHEFLETFYNLSLPAEEDEPVINEWGVPGSDKRKQRLYDYLTGLAAFREMMDPKKYNMAIEHWQEDADFAWAL